MHIPDELDFGQYTLEARKAIGHSISFAMAAGANAITPDHLLAAMADPGVYCAKYLQLLRFDGNGRTPRQSQAPSGGSEVGFAIPMDPDLRKALVLARQEARDAGRERTGSADILLGILLFRESADPSAQVSAAISDIRIGMTTDRAEGQLPLE